jgi:hypothetical protein
LLFVIRKSRIANEYYDTQTPRYSGYAKAACDWRHGLVLTGIDLEMSQSEIHAAIKRATMAGLANTY